MDRKQREERRRQEDIALQRGLLWVVGAAVLEALLVLVNRYYINYFVNEVNITNALDKVLRFLRLGAPVAAVLALAWTFWLLRQGKKFGWQLVLALGLAAVSVCAHVIIKFWGPGVSMLFWLVVAWAVLALVYYIYQREFFLAACACGMSVLALWFVRYEASGRMEALLLLAAIAVVTDVVFQLKKRDGVLSIGREPVQFLPKKTSYSVLLVTCAASLAVIIAAMLLGGTAAYYLMFVMVAWLFALFVYYTVKLM
ncbi:MAG: hypothetical protein HFF52_09775 [Lawsonibacter sp.]|nr:hypothetical protein [Lawsonibacter sp.]